MEMHDWPGFEAGHEYSVELKDSKEIVRVGFVEDGDEQYVTVDGIGTGTLFDRVLGRVVYALSAHSDNVMVYRVEGPPNSHSTEHDDS